MREIKFRQPLFKPNNEFFKFHYWGDVEGGFQSPVNGNLGRNSQMFTGLKDKNGKEIYEGDILRAYHSEYDEVWNEEVKFRDGTFTLGRYWKDGIHDWYSMEQFELFEMEIIGNIYENPESLLNITKNKKVVENNGG